MWQPRGLNYPLYTVLSRHHAETNGFSLSFLQREQDTAGDSSAVASSPPTATEDAVAPRLAAHALLSEEEASGDRDKAPEATEVPSEISRQCGTCVAGTDNVLVQQEHEEVFKAFATSVRSGFGVENGYPNESRGDKAAEALHAADASPRVQEQRKLFHTQHSQGVDEEDEKGKPQEKAQQRQQGYQPQLVSYQQQQQRIQKKTQGEQQQAGHHRELERKQRQEEERQRQGDEQSQQSEVPLPGYCRRVSAESPLRTAVAEEDKVSDTCRSGCAEAKRRDAATADGTQGEALESREACQQTTATSSSVVSPLASPRARPVPVSARSIRDSTTAYQSSNERSFGGRRVCADAYHVPPAATELLPVSGPAATAASAAASGNRGDTLCRAPSLRRPVVPSFRVLILFGSTSGVSAAVAFSIFHTLVHRLLSCSKRMQAAYLQDRGAASSTAAVSPTIAATARVAPAAAKSPTPCPEEATSVSVFAERCVVTSSGCSSAGVSEREGRDVTATARSRTTHSHSGEPAEPSPRRDNASSCGRPDSLESSMTDAATGLHSTTVTGKEPPLWEERKSGLLNSQQGSVESARQRERKHVQQRERDGKDQCQPPHEERKEKGHAREGRNSQGRRQQLQHRNGQHHTQQQDEHQQNVDSPHRQSACLQEEASPVTVRCGFPEDRECISEKREAAAQAAEVASMGLKAAAAIASAALKAGEQHDAARRAGAATSEPRSSYAEQEEEEAPRMWFLDEVQIGRVGVFIQSMQYLTLEDFLEFVEESRAASVAATAAAAREAPDTGATGQANCRADTETATSLVAETSHNVDLVGTSLREAAADAGTSGCLCGNSPVFLTTQGADDCGFWGNSSSVGTSGCCASPPSLTAGSPAAVSDSTTGVDGLSKIPHTLVLYCISTNTGGTPPESAAPFFAEMLEAADDFRVGRGSLQGCCVAGVGCGSTDYPHSTFCKPARQLMTPLQRLGAQALMQQPLLLLTDTSAAATTEMKLAKWRQHLMQQVECLLQATANEDVQRLLQDANRSTASSRQKQPRQQSQQPQRRDHEAYDGVSDGQGKRAGEEARLKPTASSQEFLSPVANGVFKTNGSVCQGTTLDFASVTESAFDSDEQSASDHDSCISDVYDDGGGGGTLPAGEGSRLSSDKGLSSNKGRSRSLFAGVGTAICGGSGREDVEDVADGSDEAGAEHNGDTASLSQVKRPQTDHIELTQRQRGDHLRAEMVGHVSQSRKRDTRKRAPGAEGHACAGEDGRRGFQQRDGSRNGTGTHERMVKPRHAEQLKKEGYRLIGSHSAVKLCRWTKSQLRGRGGCYKHTFYGITSSQCMEMTPSLACANKCVFCWRHHKNPVGTSWRWQMDDEKFVVEEAITQHFKAIKELKGMAEVKQDRLDAARTIIRHCALSLVGEPIMYPRIAALVKLLHEKRISTFMVTNAQFPEALASLPPVTQLYLSVDAASPADLKTIDQPLFTDYWERFVKCMDILKSKRQRTVYRLTLVAGYNMPDLATLEPAESQVQSEVRNGFVQETDSVQRPRLSDEAKVCQSTTTEGVTLEKAERGVSDPASHSGFAWGGAAAGLSGSPSSAAHAVRSPSTPSSTQPSCLNPDVETEFRGKSRSRAVEGGLDRDLAGRSANAYAALVLKGLPDFIEVKAVTYAGTSKHSKLTMKNIPWHDQVVAFCKNLCEALPKGAYELACEHRHSCCVLIAKTEYKKNGQWHTWINYEKFHELATSGRNDFAGTDYCAPTPDWATFGHMAAGFSPLEARIYTKGKQKRLHASATIPGACEA